MSITDADLSFEDECSTHSSGDLRCTCNPEVCQKLAPFFTNGVKCPDHDRMFFNRHFFPQNPTNGKNLSTAVSFTQHFFLQF